MVKKQIAWKFTGLVLSFDFHCFIPAVGYAYSILSKHLPINPWTELLLNFWWFSWLFPIFRRGGRIFLGGLWLYKFRAQRDPWANPANNFLSGFQTLWNLEWPKALTYQRLDLTYVADTVVCRSRNLRSLQNRSIHVVRATPWYTGASATTCARLLFSLA